MASSSKRSSLSSKSLVHPMLSLSPPRKVHSSTSFLRRPKTLVANGNVVHLQQGTNPALAPTIQQAPWPRNDEEYNKSRKSAPNLLEELRPSVVTGNIESNQMIKQ